MQQLWLGLPCKNWTPEPHKTLQHKERMKERRNHCVPRQKEPPTPTPTPTTKAFILKILKRAMHHEALLPYKIWHTFGVEGCPKRVHQGNISYGLCWAIRTISSWTPGHNIPKFCPLKYRTDLIGPSSNTTGFSPNKITGHQNTDRASLCYNISLAAGTHFCGQPECSHNPRGNKSIK